MRSSRMQGFVWQANYPRSLSAHVEERRLSDDPLSCSPRTSKSQECVHRSLDTDLWKMELRQQKDGWAMVTGGDLHAECVDAWRGKLGGEGRIGGLGIGEVEARDWMCFNEMVTFGRR